MRVDLDGRVALVTGTERPIGHAVAACLVANGGRVAHDNVAGAIGRFGRLDILVNCVEGDPDADGAVAAAARLSRGAAEAMAGQGGGRILSIVSALGIVAVRGEAARAAAHAGVLSLTRSLSLEWAGSGVLVNAIAALGGDPLREDRLISHTALGRLATPQEIAQAALFLLAPAASYFVGHVLTLDGGWTAGYARDF